MDIDELLLLLSKKQWEPADKKLIQQMILEREVITNIDQPAESGENALMLAIWHYHDPTLCYQVVKYLLDKEIMDIKSSSGTKALSMALNLNHTAIAQLLFQYGADPYLIINTSLTFAVDDKKNYTPLMRATEIGADDLIKPFIDKVVAKSSTQNDMQAWNDRVINEIKACLVIVDQALNYYKTTSNLEPKAYVHIRQLFKEYLSDYYKRQILQDINSTPLIIAAATGSIEDLDKVLAAKDPRLSLRDVKNALEKAKYTGQPDEVIKKLEAYIAANYYFFERIADAAASSLFAGPETPVKIMPQQVSVSQVVQEYDFTIPETNNTAFRYLEDKAPGILGHLLTHFENQISALQDPSDLEDLKQDWNAIMELVPNPNEFCKAVLAYLDNTERIATSRKTIIFREGQTQAADLDAQLRADINAVKAKVR